VLEAASTVVVELVEEVGALRSKLRWRQPAQAAQGTHNTGLTGRVRLLADRLRHASKG
jgi:hypothetical protein